MPPPRAAVTFNLSHELVESYAINEQMNQLLLAQLDPRAWRSQPSGRRVRTIAAIFSHVHNVRRKWLRLSAPHLNLPPALNHARCTQEEVRAALAESSARCCEMLAEALEQPDGRVKSFLRDGWAKPWPAGPAMAAYMIAHDAHHRGQVCMLTHQLGYPLSASVTSNMWAWEKLRKQSNLSGSR
jgi:uncharacterized damage-inducible protein DinB